MNPSKLIEVIKIINVYSKQFMQFFWIFALIAKFGEHLSFFKNKRIFNVRISSALEKHCYTVDTLMTYFASSYILNSWGSLAKLLSGLLEQICQLGQTIEAWMGF